MRSRSFFYVSLGILALAFAYHLGVSSATAQSGSGVVGVSTGICGEMVVITQNGDVYSRFSPSGCWSPGMMTSPPQLVGNFWNGAGPTPATQQTWGQVKARYR